jgi:hypothetical protein
MSKAISFGFGKSKPVAATKTAPPKPTPRKSQNGLLHIHDSDDDDDEHPQHESVTGFSSGGAVLSKPVAEKEVKVIQNSGNNDWRTRGRKNLLPEEVQAARNGDVVIVERDEVSTASGLQYSAPKSADAEAQAGEGATALSTGPANEEPAKQLTEDDIAMAALLGDKPKSNAIIASRSNARLNGQDETTDFREDVASRPDSSTLEDYAAMPVEEFGMAMLRGMGQKRKAAGQTINLEGEKEANPRKVRKQEGFLGIGAKAAPGSDIELGAWGKAEMRKNNRGEGFFTPLMREDRKTGERITEEEFQRRIKESKEPKKEEDWRERRDRNLEKSGRDRDRDRERDRDRRYITNGDDHDSSRASSSSRRERSDRDEDKHRSRRQRDERDYDRSRSKRERSRSRDRSRRDHDEYSSKSRERHRDRDRYRDEDRYDSSSSHRSKHRERDSDHDKSRR